MLYRLKVLRLGCKLYFDYKICIWIYKRFKINLYDVIVIKYFLDVYGREKRYRFYVFYCGFLLVLVKKYYLYYKIFWK